MILSVYDRLVMTVVYSPIDSVIQSLSDFLLSPSSKEKYLVKHTNMSLEEIYKGSPPIGSAHQKRVLAYSSGKGTTLIANLEDGWQSLGYVLSKDLGVRAITLQIHSLSDDNPANGFSVIENGKCIRHASVRKDEKWLFHVEGSIQPFENYNLYTKRLIKDRLPPNEIIRIAEEIGIALNSDGFSSRKRDGVIFAQIVN